MTTKTIGVSAGAMSTEPTDDNIMDHTLVENAVGTVASNAVAYVQNAVTVWDIPSSRLEASFETDSNTEVDGA